MRSLVQAANYKPGSHREEARSQNAEKSGTSHTFANFRADLSSSVEYPKIGKRVGRPRFSLSVPFLGPNDF